MQIEAEEKFRGIYNVDVMTAHSFALKCLIRKMGTFSIKNKLDYDVISDIVFKGKDKSFKYTKHNYFHDLHDRFCNTKQTIEQFTDFMLKILKENDDELKVPYSINPMTPKHVFAFKKIYDTMVERKLFTHSMYLKLAAMGKLPSFPYKYILFDEAQDANGHMLEIVKKIPAPKKYFVGDEDQEIYSFSGTVNAFDEFDCAKYSLTKSFRFDQDIADLAVKILSIKTRAYIEGTTQQFKSVDCKNVTVLYRTNAAILEAAMGLTLSPIGQYIKISYLSNDEKNGIIEQTANGLKQSQYDSICFIYEALKDEMRDTEAEELLRLFNIKYVTLPEIYNPIKEYIKEGAKNGKLISMMEAISDIGRSLDDSIIKMKKLYEKYSYNVVDMFRNLVEAENRTDAEFKFTLITAHRSKGLEWDLVIIGDEDAWSLKQNEEMFKKGYEYEVNLQYVACTRARRAIDATSLYRHLVDADLSISMEELRIVDCDNEDEVRSWLDFYIKALPKVVYEIEQTMLPSGNVKNKVVSTLTYEKDEEEQQDMMNLLTLVDAPEVVR